MWLQFTAVNCRGLLAIVVIQFIRFIRRRICLSCVLLRAVVCCYVEQGFGVVLLAQDAALPEDSRQGQYALKQMLCQSRE